MRLSPLEIGNLVLRNIVPIAGLVFFHWSAANLLILYFIDTLLAVAVIVAGFLYSQFPDEEAEGLAARLNTIVGYAAGALFLALLFAVPLGMPIFILVFGVGDVSFMGMLRDPGFQAGLGLQAVASLVSFRDLVAALHRYTPEALGLKRRFAFVMLRWVGTMIVAYVPLTFLLGRFGPLLLVVVYIALTIFAELMPDRFLAAFGELGRDVASDAPGARTAKGLPESPGAHAHARRRHPQRKH
ncbi:MAG: DUF6498-containing protein [Betaproteobacteria bacterium]